MVPVLAAYEDEIVRLAEEAGDEYLVGGNTTHRNRTNEIAARFEDGHNHPKLEPKRLRSTWIVTHLTLGTRLPELLAAAGTSSDRDLRRLAQVRAGDGPRGQAHAQGMS